MALRMSRDSYAPRSSSSTALKTSSQSSSENTAPRFADGGGDVATGTLGIVAIVGGATIGAALELGTTGAVVGILGGGTTGVGRACLGVNKPGAGATGRATVVLAVVETLGGATKGERTTGAGLRLGMRTASF